MAAGHSLSLVVSLERVTGQQNRVGEDLGARDGEEGGGRRGFLRDLLDLYPRSGRR
uniref:Uncharacterized protein n=2 Tax=Oryza TaxID=4527 RepID=Q6Z6N4_ORYSJ|nr:hypothetical protein [Oryza sativa Japonica Group]BAD31004.1 hypothetical protein [Oryza sativa Japonica Group]